MADPDPEIAGSGFRLMASARAEGTVVGMTRFLLLHRHAANECATAWAAWCGHESPLRGLEVSCTCLHGRHRIWWEVDAVDAETALALLPPYVASRSRALPVRRVVTP
jgi:hypothetical protein